MATKSKLPTSVTTPRFRNSFPAIFTPKLNKLNGKFEYSIQCIFEKGADLSSIKTAMENACINMWGSDKKKWPSHLINPIKSQKDLITKAEAKGQPTGHLHPEAFYIVAKTGAKDKDGKDKPHPPVVGKNPKEIIEEESRFYAGCWAKANINVGAYEKGPNKGLAIYLNACQFVGDAEPFSGKRSPETAFEAIPEEVTDAGDATDMFS